MTLAASPLKHEADLYMWVKEDLLRIHGDLDEDTLADTLEGITSLPDMLSAAVRAHLDDKALLEALKVRIGDLKTRLDRLDTRIQATRSLIGEAMDTAGLRKLVEADFTLSLREGSKPLMVIDEGAIPDKYWVIQPPKLDRQSLKRALADRKDIPGAVLGEPAPSISVRVR